MLILNHHGNANIQIILERNQATYEQDFLSEYLMIIVPYESDTSILVLVLFGLHLSTLTCQLSTTKFHCFHSNNVAGTVSLAAC